MQDGDQAADPMAGAVGFAQVLRAAGLPVGADDTARYLRALRAVDLADRAQVYWAGRASLCRSSDDLPRYDLAFDSWFGGASPPAAPRGARVRPARIAGLAQSAPDGAPGGRDADEDGEVLK